MPTDLCEIIANFYEFLKLNDDCEVVITLKIAPIFVQI